VTITVTPKAGQHGGRWRAKSMRRGVEEHWPVAEGVGVRLMMVDGQPAEGVTPVGKGR
jgi:hypothetical protein